MRLMIIPLAALLLSAQVPIDASRVWQRGEQVGWVFGNALEAGQRSYTEHWVLYPNFKTPTAKSPERTQVAPDAGGEFKDEWDFLRRVPFPAGSRYVKTAVVESDMLPAVQK